MARSAKTRPCSRSDGRPLSATFHDHQLGAASVDRETKNGIALSRTHISDSLPREQGNPNISNMVHHYVETPASVLYWATWLETNEAGISYRLNYLHFTHLARIQTCNHWNVYLPLNSDSSYDYSRWVAGSGGIALDSRLESSEWCSIYLLCNVFVARRLETGDTTLTLSLSTDHLELYQFAIVFCLLVFRTGQQPLDTWRIKQKRSHSCFIRNCL